jgi:RNA polymerase sigma-70 factor (ECF subfamily)
MPTALTRFPLLAPLSWRTLLAPAEPFASLSVPTVDPRVAAAARGDRKAAQSLLTELLPRARNLIRYLVRGDTDVDDIAQEALISVVRGLPGYRGEGAFQSWVDRIVARTAFAQLSKTRAERNERSNEAPELLAVPAEGRGDNYVMRRELAALLDKLPDEQRHAVVLHHALGMTVPEITQATGAPFETVRSRLRLGMAALRGLLGHTGQEEDDR